MTNINNKIEKVEKSINEIKQDISDIVFNITKSTSKKDIKPYLKQLDDVAQFYPVYITKLNVYLIFVTILNNLSIKDIKDLLSTYNNIGTYVTEYLRYYVNSIYSIRNSSLMLTQDIDVNSPITENKDLFIIDEHRYKISNKLINLPLDALVDFSSIVSTIPQDFLTESFHEKNIREYATYINIYNGSIGISFYKIDSWQTLLSLLNCLNKHNINEIIFIHDTNSKFKDTKFLSFQVSNKELFLSVKNRKNTIYYQSTLSIDDLKSTVLSSTKLANMTDEMLRHIINDILQYPSDPGYYMNVDLLVTKSTDFIYSFNREINEQIKKEIKDSELTESDKNKYPLLNPYGSYDVVFGTIEQFFLEFMENFSLQSKNTETKHTDILFKDLFGNLHDGTDDSCDMTVVI